jgi:hypothetical protein
MIPKARKRDLAVSSFYANACSPQLIGLLTLGLD